MPNKRETSVFRISGLREEEIWDIGTHFVAKARNRPLKGRIDIVASHVLQNGLKLKPDPSSHRRHANIIWPEEESIHVIIAEELAKNAELFKVIVSSL